MTGTKPSTGYTVRRAFRGSVLWLTHYEARPLSMQWSTRGERLKFESSAAALAAADKAAREYGAECAVLDPSGNLLQPNAARAALRHHVTGAIERGEKTAVVEQRYSQADFRAQAERIAAARGWTVELETDRTGNLSAWFLDSNGRDVAQSYLRKHLDALEQE